MFTKVILKNFRSFDNISFDLSENNNTAKQLVIVYGENGSGKSNLMSSFVFLSELLKTMDVRDRYEELLNRVSLYNDENIIKQIQQEIIASMRDIRAIIEDYRMVGSEEPISACFEFVIGGSKGLYTIELGSTEIIHERLEFKLNQRKGLFFDYNNDDTYLYPGIVKDKDFLYDIKATAKRFWGKHSLLAIILHEIQDKSSSYGKENLSDNFADVLYEFRFISCNVGIADREWKELSAPIYMLRYPIEGKILKRQEKQIDIIENLFSSFFSSINSNILRLEYKRTYVENYIEYRLCIVRMLADTYRSIDFSKESKGNHQLLTVFCFLLTACFGGIVILDEADSGIHDLLFQKIIADVCQYIQQGQLIMTTHNTLLMESDIDRSSIYVISEEAGCHKKIQCIYDYKKRTYIGNNIRNKYLHNEYNGLPKVDKIDFNGLINYVIDHLDDIS